MNSYLIPILPYPHTTIKSGEGSYLFDVSGKKYLDFNSGQFCTILGHSNKLLQQKIDEANSKLVHTSSGLLSESVIKAGEVLHTLSGKLKAYCIFLSTGAEAVEFSLRYAKHITKKSGLICFNRGYHGLTLGAQSITFSGKYTVPSVPNIYSIPVPNETYHIDQINDILKGTETILREKEIAAVVIEPVVSVGGMIFLSEYFLHELRNLCTKHKVLLIFDECQTGFGRLGYWFAYQKYDIVPDMVVTAKGFGLGYPVSAVLFNETVVKTMDFGMTHYSSHQNDAFAANIVLDGIEFIKKENILKKVQESGMYFLKQLQDLAVKNMHVLNPRGQGLMLGIDLKEITNINSRTLYQKLSQLLLEEGIIIQGTDGGRVLRFLPDYLITQTDIAFGINTISECITKVYKQYGA